MELNLPETANENKQEQIKGPTGFHHKTSALQAATEIQHSDASE